MKIAVIYFELFLLTFTFTGCLSTPSTSVKNKTYWHKLNYELIRQRLAYFDLKPENLVRVKNVILFVGDGMGLTTVTASRVYKKQKLKNSESKLVFDDFPASALIQTDTANSQISESAAAATALFCGVKTNFENLGVDATAEKNACNSSDSHATSIISWAQNKNLKTGFVTTSRITHATPAALYAHSRRHMEDDSKADATCKDIARQLIEDAPGKHFNVIFGGGLRSFLSENEQPGRRKDERNLTAEWLEKHQNGEFITDRSQMMNLRPETDYVLGIFASSHMHFNADRNKDEEPSLAEMTATAINVLKRKNSNGFFLVVEGGKIDLAHHYNNAFRALDDTLALDEAVEVAIRRVDLSETLIVVTSDHASAVVYSGFATPKDYSILGMDKFVSNIDKKPYQLLTYSSGLGHDYFNETWALVDNRNTYHKATIPSTWSNHAGDDVPLYAVGALANILFGGTMDQTYVPHAIAFAMCLFDYQDRCNRRSYLQKIDMQRERPPNKIHLLKYLQKLQQDALEKQEKEKHYPNELDSLETSTLGFMTSSEQNFYQSPDASNDTDMNFRSTSDLVGNISDEASSIDHLNTSVTFVLFHSFLIMLVVT